MHATTKPAVTLQYRRMIIPTETASLGVENDRNAECVAFVLPRLYEGIDLATKSFFVDTMSDNGGLFSSSDPEMTYTDEEIRLLWTVGALPASNSGIVRLRLRALGENFLWQTETGTFQLAATFATEDPPDLPGQSYFDNALLQVVALRDQAAASADAAATSAVDAQDWATSATASAGGMASRWSFYVDGASVSFTPSASSVIQATSTATTMLTFNGANQSITAKTPINLTAIAGKNTISVASGTVLVGYNRESIEVIKALTVPTSATAAMPAIYPTDGLPLELTARILTAQSGTGTPAPDNVRAIPGKNAIRAARYGKNLLDPNVAGLSNWDSSDGYYGKDQHTRLQGDGSIHFYGTPAVNGWNNTITLGKFPLFLPRGTYAFRVGMISGFNGTVFGLRLQTAAGVFIEDMLKIARNNGEVYEHTFTLAADTYCQALIGQAAGVTVDLVFTVQLCLGATAPFEPCVGNAFSIALPQSLYGLPAAMDAVQASGAITKNTCLYTFSGAENFTMLAPGQFSLAKAGFASAPKAAASAATVTTAICSHYKSASRNDTSGTTACFAIDQAADFVVHDARYTTAADFKAWLAAESAAGRTVQLLYELASPQALSATPIVIPAQSGLNQAFCDGGGDTTLAGRLSMQRFYDLAKGAGWAL